MRTMKAVRFHEFGGPEVLVYEDAPCPEPGAGEILVKVHAAGVNPVDWKVRAGMLTRLFAHTLPLIPGWDFSGVVEAVGAGVAGFKEGDEVYARPDLTRNGAYAEYIAVRASEVAIKPKTIDHVMAASIPLAALTAWQVLFDVAQIEPGQKVLIHAAAGGVGVFAVQLAKMKGAYVIGTASQRNHEFLKELGADELIDYNTTRFEDAVQGVDVVFDMMAGDTQQRSWQVLKKGGILVTIVGRPSKEEAAAHPEVRPAWVFVQPNAPELAEIAALVDSGKLRLVVDMVLPLMEARRAHELIATEHTRGKIVLRVV